MQMSPACTTWRDTLVLWRMWPWSWRWASTRKAPSGIDWRNSPSGTDWPPSTSTTWPLSSTNGLIPPRARPMPDRHHRHTPQNARGGNDLITKREAYAGTKRMIDAASTEILGDVFGVIQDNLRAHVAE